MKIPIRRIFREIKEHLIGKFGILIIVLFILFLLTGISIGYILGYANGFKTAVNTGIDFLKHPDQVRKIINYFERVNVGTDSVQGIPLASFNWSCNFTA